MHGLDLGQLGFGDALRGQLARLRFQPGHDLKGIQYVVLGQLDGNGAAIGQQLDQSFGRQHLDGFAQRCARDIENRAEFALIKFGARCDAVFNQHLAQSVRRLLMQGGTSNGKNGDDFSDHG